MRREKIWELINNFSIEKLEDFFRSASDSFAPEREDLSRYISHDDGETHFQNVTKTGEICFPTQERLIVCVVSCANELTSRSGKKRQYELAKKILKENVLDAGIFVFLDANGHYRFSFIKANYFGPRRKFTSFKRYTFFVSQGQTNKTFVNQFIKADFTSIDKITDIFSIEAVSNDFYNEFSSVFAELSQNVVCEPSVTAQEREDFALLFVIRIIFLGFVQKKRWIGQNEHFLADYLCEYKSSGDPENSFYLRWLKPLFFEALNSPPGSKVAYGNNRFSPDTEKVLQMAPFLNGELFKQVPDLDDIGYSIPDMQVEKFFNFLAQYNFTIDENTITDEELELNPEFLGIIFERLVNQEDGAVYTPRTEVDFMCRIALVKWLEKNSVCGKKDLYRFLFRELGSGDESEEDQHQGDFSPREMKDLHGLLSRVTVCDPAAGSGAFEVGMLHVLHDALDNLENRPHFPEDIQKLDSFERKKEIIANTLYGVEVKKWAVWINQLRLWLTLFIDMPEDFRMSREPLLPSLGFKVRCGDSLIQRVGGRLFPVRGDAQIGETAKRRLKSLQKHKYDFFFNRGKTYEFVKQEEYKVFRTILEEEIKQKETTLAQLRGIVMGQEGQVGLGFAEDQTVIKDRSLNLNRERIAELENEADELRLECRKLVADHPFVWNIEFSEIFFDRGGFDIVIGNPPYVRQESIDDPLGKVSTATEYKELLRQMVARDFPGHFGSGRSINGRSDLYTFFYIRSLRILNSKGIHVFICSNSWLDVGYGAWLQEFLLRNVPVHFIFDNQAKRSFANADVNTVITVMGAPEERAHTLDNLLRFVSIRKPFEESVFTEKMLAIEESNDLFTDETLRVVPKTAKELLEEGMDTTESESNPLSAIYAGNKWGGKYLRAPDIFFTILEKGKGKFVKLKDIAEIRFGIKTGCNEFFYLSQEDVEKWKIEPEFLKPVIKTLQECKTYGISGQELKSLAFYCHQSKQELKNKFPNSYKYVLWGESQGYSLRRSVQGRRYWWSLPSQEKASFIIMRFRDKRNWAPIILGDFLVGDVVFVGSSFSKKDDASLRYSLNSTLQILFSEIFGRINLGEGLLTTYGPDINPMFCVRPTLLDFQVFDHSQFLSREVKSVFPECGINPESEIPIEEQEPNPFSDRAALDKIVFDALELTEEERKGIYRAVCQLVWDRISRARSV